MGIGNFIGNFFAYIIMSLCITAIFLSLFAANLIENTDNIEDTITKNTKQYAIDHKEEVQEFLMSSADSSQLAMINKDSLTQLCAVPDAQISQDLCSRLDMLTEEEAKDQFIKEMLDKQLSEGTIDTYLQKFSKEAGEEIRTFISPIKQTIGNPAKYALLGIIGYLIAVGLIFLTAKFDVKTSLYKIARNTFLIALPFILAFWYIAALTPAYVLSLITKLPAAKALSEVPAFLVNLIITIALDIIKASTNPLLIIAIILGAASLALAITMKILTKKEATTKPDKKHHS